MSLFLKDSIKILSLKQESILVCNKSVIIAEATITTFKIIPLKVILSQFKVHQIGMVTKMAFSIESVLIVLTYFTRDTIFH